jgi:Ca2+-binding EF-hand superfamily protein
VAGFVELLGEEKYEFAEECARHVMVRLRKTKLGFS